MVDNLNPRIRDELNLAFDLRGQQVPSAVVDNIMPVYALTMQNIIANGDLILRTASRNAAGTDIIYTVPAGRKLWITALIVNQPTVANINNQAAITTDNDGTTRTIAYLQHFSTAAGLGYTTNTPLIFVVPIRIESGKVISLTCSAAGATNVTLIGYLI